MAGAPSPANRVISPRLSFSWLHDDDAATPPARRARLGGPAHLLPAVPRGRARPRRGPRRGTSRVVFLPSHSALIDPALLMVQLDPGFQPRALADEYQISRPIVGPLARLFGARALPNMERQGLSVMDATRRALDDTIAGRARGREPALLPVRPPAAAAPRGDSRRERRRDPREGAARGALRPGADDRPLGQQLQPARSTARCRASWRRRCAALKYLLLNGIFFMPRRARADRVRGARRLPARASRGWRSTRYLEAFYNAARAAQHLRAVRVLGEGRRAGAAGPRGAPAVGRRRAGARGDAPDRHRGVDAADRAQRRSRSPTGWRTTSASTAWRPRNWCCGSRRSSASRRARPRAW